MVVGKSTIDFEKAETDERVTEGTVPRKSGRKPGQIYVTTVRQAKRELMRVYNALVRGEIDPHVAQARRAILWTWINSNHLDVDEVVELRKEMAAYRELLRQKGRVLTGHEGR